MNWLQVVVSRIFYFGYSDARNGWNGNGKDSASENERMVLIFVTAVEEYVFRHLMLQHFIIWWNRFQMKIWGSCETCSQKHWKYSEINRMKIHDGAVRRKPYESVLKDIVYAEVYNRKVIIHTRDTNIEYYGNCRNWVKLREQIFSYTQSLPRTFQICSEIWCKLCDDGNGTALIAKQNYSEFVKQYLKYNQRKGKEIGWVW